MSDVSAPGSPAPSKRKVWLRRLLGAFGYLAILALAYRTIDHEVLAEGLRQLRVSHILLILAIALLHVAGRAYRYHCLLLRSSPANYRWIDGFAIFSIGLSTSAVTPARAGDFVKAQMVRRYGVPFSAGFGLVLIERVLDLLVLTLSILGAGFLVSGNSSASWSRAALVLLGVVVVGVVTLTNRSLRGRCAALASRALRRVSKKSDDGVASKIEAVFSTWDALFASPTTLLLYLAGSMVVWAIDFSKLWCVLALLGVSVPVESIFFVYPVSLLAGVLTVLPFSEGVVGVTGVAILSSIAHVNPAVATIAVVTDRGISGLLPLALAVTSPLWARGKAQQSESTHP